jgi:hypothetical protein
MDQREVDEAEAQLARALGLSNFDSSSNDSRDPEQQFIPDPYAEQVDLSKLRGVASGDNKKVDDDSETDLEALAELVPDIKSRRKNTDSSGIEVGSHSHIPMPAQDQYKSSPALDEVIARADCAPPPSDEDSTDGRRLSMPSATDYLKHTVSTQANGSRDVDDVSKLSSMKGGNKDRTGHVYKPSKGPRVPDDEDEEYDEDTLGEYPRSEHVLGEAENVSKDFMNPSSGQSISTATQTHEMRMPMFLPTFKPATGCTNASDFVVRCFVARLRSGITVVKHGRSRWCKSRLRVLHIHPDGRSLSWRPAEGEPTTNRRPPKLDLSTCLEVRHAWSPDPHNPVYTGTPILRQKCEAANAHKSFALIFKGRTVDITAVTADQCKVLMEGFSALCFRLQVANLAGRKKTRPMPEEDGISTTASNTLTNNSSAPRR